MHHQILPAWLAIVVVALSLPLAGHAQSQMTPGNARAIKVAGTVWHQSKARSSKTQLKEGEFLQRGSTINTAANGTAVLLFENGSTLQIQPGTRFSIDEFLVSPFDADKVNFQKIKSEPTKSVTEVTVHEGSVLANIAKLNRASTYNIATPLGTAGIRGTTLGVRSTRRSSTFVVTQGTIQVTKRDGTFWILSGDKKQAAGEGENTRTASDRQRNDETVVISLDQNYRDPGAAAALGQEARSFGENPRAGTPSNPFGGAPSGAGEATGGEGGGGWAGGGGSPPPLPGGWGGGGGGGGGGTVNPPQPYGQ